MTDEPITDEWLSACDFKWRQNERQPNKHWSLKLNTDDVGWRTFSQVSIEVQRRGWENDKGEYIGNPDSWMLWVTDTFGRTAFLGNIHSKKDIISLAEIITHRPWNPATHLYGQAWPENSHVLRERSKT